MNAVAFNLKYKGARSYLQGGDIYNAIVGELSPRLGGYLSRLVFKHFARNQIELLLDEPTDLNGMMASGVWQAKEKAQQFWIRETDLPVIESYPFDEEAITAAAKISNETISGTRSNPYSLIENIIALTKMLNYALSPNVDGKWIFAQLDSTRCLPIDWDTVGITRKIAVGNSFSRNSIMVNGIDYGEIRFIGGNP